MKTLFLFSLLAIGFLAVYAADDSSSEETVNIVTKTDDDSSEESTKRDEKPVKPWKKHDFRRREPEFLSEVEEPAKTEFFAIKYNKDLTKTEKTQQMKDWAEKYEKVDEVQKFLDDKKADCDKKKQERKENYERLGDLIEKADAILDDEENTWATANQKLDELVKSENREVAKAFATFYPWIGEGHGHGRHGHRFHHGKRFGGKNRSARNIGMGASPKQHHGIGHGAEPGRRDYGNANMNYDPYGNEKHHKHHKHHGF